MENGPDCTDEDERDLDWHMWYANQNELEVLFGDIRILDVRRDGE